MGIFREFKTFIKRGNVLDMAVGVIVGGAFAKIITSLVDDLLMPVIGLATKDVDFAKLSLALGDGPDAAVLKYGNFIQRSVDFLITAFCVFVLIRLIHKVHAKPTPAPAAPPAPTPSEKLLTEIRDLLTKR